LKIVYITCSQNLKKKIKQRAYMYTLKKINFYFQLKKAWITLEKIVTFCSSKQASKCKIKTSETFKLIFKIIYLMDLFISRDNQKWTLKNPGNQHCHR